MGLSTDLISQFVKVTKDQVEPKHETTVFGTIQEYDGKKYVKLDGSDLLTPISSTADAEVDERVTVLIKNHEAIVTGNMSSPAARTETVEKMGDQITEVEILIAYRVTTEDLAAVTATIDSLKAKVAKFNDMTAVNAQIESLEAKFASLTTVTAKDVTAINAEIENLRATFGTFTDISTEDLDAVYADIDILRGHTAEYTYVSAEVLSAVKAAIKELDAKKLSAEDASLKYANIDFANIGEAAVKKFFATSGVVKDLVIENGVAISGEIVGVTIKGDLIEGGTVVADKLVVKGEDGLYYKLNTDGATVEAEQTEYNSLDGSVITAKSITATKINVSDLVAFGATIGGFKITENSIYSGVKESADNTTRGLYMDVDGQMVFGDAENFVKFYRDEADGLYYLDITSAGLNTTITSIQNELAENVSAIQSDIEGVNSDVEDLKTKSDNATESINTLKSQVELAMTSDDVSIMIQNEMANGSNRVVTSTGYIFDENGMTVSKSDSEMKTEITEDGMTVYKNEEEMLRASNEGVDAVNLHATTYLIIGNNSRFEDYGNRTACFWIGGNN